MVRPQLQPGRQGGQGIVQAVGPRVAPAAPIMPSSTKTNNSRRGWARSRVTVPRMGSPDVRRYFNSRL